MGQRFYSLGVYPFEQNVHTCISFPAFIPFMQPLSQKSGRLTIEVDATV